MNTTPSKKHNPFIYSDMADRKFTYEIPGQHYLHGLLLPGEFSEEECEKAMKTKFHKDDIMLTSYPKAGKNQQIQHDSFNIFHTSNHVIPT